LIALAAGHGVQYLFAAVVLAGILQLLVGLFKLGKFVRLIPQPVMYGFLNGLAIIIFMAQVQQFRLPSDPSSWMSGTALYTMLQLTFLSGINILWLQKLNKKLHS